MKIKYVCTEVHTKMIQEILESRGIETGNGILISLIERGFPLAGEGLELVFDGNSINACIAFLETFTSARTTAKFENIITGRKNGSFQPLEIKMVYYFQADGNTIYCFTEKDKYEVQGKLFELEEEMKNREFIRINKSEIVNICQISEIIPWFGGRLLLKLKKRKEELEVSRNFAKNFKTFLGM